MSGLLTYLLPGKGGVLSALLTAGLLLGLQLTPLHTVTSARSYTIEAKAGKGGEIDPSGKVRVERGDSQSFRIIPDAGYEIGNVRVDGRDLGPLERYTFYFVRSNHKIEATFSRKTFVITATAGPGGKIDPSGEVEVKGGDDRTFRITADEGYAIADVRVDGVSQGPVDEYKFNDVEDNHVIGAFFSRTMAIRGVSIPDEPMKIGDVVPVTVTVEDDQGTTYALVSGKVGGYPLSEFRRNSSTAYSASFMVEEGGESYSASQRIPVTDLVLSSGSDQSLPYDAEINQDNDPIDASRPRILSVAVEGGTYKIGDEVLLYIEADGPGYWAGPQTSVNGILLGSPYVSFNETGDGGYLLRYVVQEGDPEADPEQRRLPASVTLLETSGNQSDAYSDIANVSQLYIDSRPPAVIRMEVPTIALGPGGILQVNLLADGTGYRAGTGTTINGVPLSSDRVSFSEGAGGAYLLSYEVGPDDPEVEAGDLEMTVVPVDRAGNLGIPYSTLEANFLEIYTTLPKATLAGPPEICQGEEVTLQVLLEGRRPLSFTLNDGIAAREYTAVTSSEVYLPVAPESTTTYRIERVMDVNGVENSGSGEVQVRVNTGTDVAFLPLAPGFAVDADPVELKANVDGGTFSGPGVISSTGMFYPELAGMSEIPHTLVYTYENSGGCLSYDSVQVYVLGSEATLLMPGSALCSGQEPVTVSAMNLAGQSGSFSLLDDSGQPVPGLEDHGDNTATLDPSLLDPGDYEVVFRYEDGGSPELSTVFTLEDVRPPLILGLDMVTVCQGISPVPLRSDMESVVFEGPGVSGNLQDGFVFDPGQADAGKSTIYATRVSEKGCQAVTSKELEVLGVPEVQFGMNAACIPDGGEMVTFRNLSTGVTEGTAWTWDFGDPGSGDENESSLEHPSHFYSAPGHRSITLTATTGDGCTATHTVESLIDSKPVADFTWVSDCLGPESGIRFINRTDYGSASPDTVLWRFYDTGGALLEETGMASGTDTLTHVFSAPGTYRVDLYTTGSGGCRGELSRQVNLRSTFRLDRDGYLETFNGSEGGWTVHSDGQTDSWTRGIPDFSGYQPEPGNEAWYTQLPSTEGYLEHSWVTSPCFDFSEMERPVIRMKIMRSFNPALSGAVIQYKHGPDQEWKTLGENTQGIGWYNASELLLEPGGSRQGWGMEHFEPDRGWVTAMHDLDDLAGHPNVLFRIAIATAGREAMGNQGFAFDDVRIAERSKLTVMEHFTDYSDAGSREADRIVGRLGKEMKKDVIDLHYHLSDHGLDPMNAMNPGPPSARAFHYGVSQVPYSVLDGGAGTGMRFTLEDLQADAPGDRVRLATLEEPAFELGLEVEWGNEGLESRTSVTCVTDQYDSYVQLYLVVFETAVTTYTTSGGDIAFRNVVLDMLPDPSGILLGDRWRNGKNVLQTESWTYLPHVEDREELAVAAFLQDRTSGQILQAAVQYRDPAVNLPEGEAKTHLLKVYPNPAGPLAHISLGNGIPAPSRLLIVDMGGKTVLDRELPAGTEVVLLDLQMLDRGAYLIRWTGERALLGVTKLLKTH